MRSLRQKVGPRIKRGMAVQARWTISEGSPVVDFRGPETGQPAPEPGRLSMRSMISERARI